MQRFRVIYIRRRGPYFAPPLSPTLSRVIKSFRETDPKFLFNPSDIRVRSFSRKIKCVSFVRKKKRKKEKKNEFQENFIFDLERSSRFRMYGICGRSRFEIFYPSALSRLLSFRAHLVSIRDSGGAGGGLVSTLCSLANGCIQAY